MNNTFLPMPLDFPVMSQAKVITLPASLEKSKRIVRDFSRAIWRDRKVNCAPAYSLSKKDWDSLFEFVFADMYYERKAMEWLICVTDPKEDVSDEVAKIEIFKGKRKVAFFQE